MKQKYVCVTGIFFLGSVLCSHTLLRKKSVNKCSTNLLVSLFFFLKGRIRILKSYIRIQYRTSHILCIILYRPFDNRTICTRSSQQLYIVSYYIKWVTILGHIVQIWYTLHGITLQELLGKNPSTEVLIDTGIGKTVRRLRKDRNPALSQIAEQCYTKWKLVLERRIELSHNKIEVKCDKVF